VAQILHLYCRRCGERLQHPKQVYCQPCNIRLCYRAMPFLLGMILTGHLATDLAEEATPSAYDDEASLIWE